MNREHIKNLTVEGIKEGYKELWIVCDTFDYMDYPVYIKIDDDINDKEKQYNSNMQRVMEKIKLI